MSASEEQGQGPVIRDNRRIDPVTGQRRDPAESAASPADRPGSGSESVPGRGADSRAGSAQSQGPAGHDGSRGSGQPRPGKHAVSKPGSPRSDTRAAGQAGPGQAQPSGNGAAQAGLDPELAVKLAERTADLQRLQAEYANYRKRVERDRVAVRENALATVMAELLPVLDDIGRARTHGELTGGFKSVAESLEAVATKLGLTAFGEAGEPFDPNVHEALMHAYSPDVTEPTAVQILQPGYRVGERILRPARVAVAEPTDPAGARTADAAAAGEDSSGARSGATSAESEADRGVEAAADDADSPDDREAFGTGESGDEPSDDST